MLQRLLLWLGFGLCHQLPERSFIAGGLQAPVCVRDAGIYLGFAIGFGVMLAMHKRRPRGLPPAHVWVTAGLWLLFMAWDGVSSYSGLRATVNELRLITGLGVGFSASALIFPMLNDELWVDSSSARVLEGVRRYAAWLGSIGLSWLVIMYAGPKLGAAFILIVALSIPVTLTLINLVIVAMWPVFDRKARSARHLLLPVVFAFLMSAGEVALAAALRYALVGAV